MKKYISAISLRYCKNCFACHLKGRVWMKRFFNILLSLMILISVTACSNEEKRENSTAESRRDTTVAEQQTEKSSVSNTNSEIDSKTQSKDDSQTDSEIDLKTNETDSTFESQQNKDKEEKEAMINIEIGEHLLTATLVQNSSTKALLEMLSEGPVTINMNDYANMEKVGSLPESLPRNDERISTDAGDLILYQGNSFVIYYDTNSWSLTRLGRINDVTKQELKEILGSGSVTAVMSLPAE